MHRDEWENFDLDVVPRLEGLRVKILYDSPYALRSLLFYHIIPHFSSKNILIAVYSDTMLRRLEKTYESIARTSPEIAEILEKTRILKIGSESPASFGRLQHALPIDSDWLKTFMQILGKLTERDLILFYGFSLLPRMYGESALKHILRMFESVPDGPTIISKSRRGIYEERINMFINMLYDVIIDIKKIEDVGLEEFYKIGISQSIVMDVMPGYARFRIDRAGRLVEV